MDEIIRCFNLALMLGTPGQAFNSEITTSWYISVCTDRHCVRGYCYQSYRLPVLMMKIQKSSTKSGVVVHTYASSTKEAEAGGT